MTQAAFKFASGLDIAERENLRFRRQWMILQVADSAPDGWVRRPLVAGFELHHHSDLAIESASGPGWSLWGLGQVYDPMSPSTRLNDLVSTPPEHVEFDIEPLMPDLAGCYVLILAQGEAVKIYTDPAAMMSIFYGQGRAASTPRLLPGAERDPEVDQAYVLRGSDDWFPGSLTPYRGIRALLANHALDVGSGEIHRFWPREEPERISHSQAVERGAELLRGGVMSVIERAPTLVSLTGGRDSRVVLAAAREAASDLEFFTIRAPGVKACDISIPEALADRFSLNHQVIDAGVADDWVLSLYDEIGSGMVTGAVRDIVGGCQQITGPTLTHMNGNLGAMTKSYFWGSRDPKTIDSKMLIRELIQRPECIRRGLDEWVATLPELEPTTAYNLMYLEQRGGRYMGIRETASNLFYASATPFNSRRLFDAISSAPVDVQFGGGLLNDYVRQLWPELLEIAYCPVTRNWGMYIPKRLKESLRRVLKQVSAR